VYSQFLDEFLMPFSGLQSDHAGGGDSQSPCRGAPMGERSRILIVDDDPQLHVHLHSTMVKKGFDVLFVRDGDRALDIIRSEHFDLILMDMNLGDRTGVEFCRAIRAVVDTVILALSSCSDDADKVAAFSAGVDDYVTKPFDTQVLLARIRANLRRRNTRPGLESLTLHDVEIDFAQRCITRNGRKTRLPRKQYQLLRFLVTRRGESLSHRELLQAVWGPDYGEETNILQVVITQVRKKIEANPRKPQYIVTIPWYGYRFEAP
jgi:two-component system, OmpR family, KDP operon response regulator KdpE